MEDNDPKPSVSPWFPETDLNTVRALGKTLEELGECTSAVSRCLIQGVEECEPVTGKPNRRWLEQEIADVLAQFEILIEMKSLDIAAIQRRKEFKKGLMAIWRAHLERP